MTQTGTGSGNEGEHTILQLAQIGGFSQGDPLNLSNSDAPGTSLTNFLFDGSNYLAWSKQVRMALGAKLKLGFIDGTLPRPTEGPDAGRWDRCDHMVNCWLINSMTADLASSFIYTNSARDLWQEVSERYNQSTTPKIFQLKQDLKRIVQGNMSVTEYYNKLKRCWDEIQWMNGIPSCSCGELAKCKCKVVARFLELEEQDRLMQFLLNLNGDYELVISNILSMDPLPSLSKAHYLVLQVENQKRFANSTTESAAFSMMSSGGKRGSSSGYDNRSVSGAGKDQRKQKSEEKKFCTHGKKDGHNMDGCFEIIGYPDWWKGKKNKKGSRMAAQVMNETPLEQPKSSTSEKYSSFDPDFLQALCQEMMKTLKGIAVMPNSSANFAGNSDVFSHHLSKQEWIIDTGATIICLHTWIA